MNVIILLFLISFAWYLSGLMADSYALKKRIRELEKEIEQHKNTISQISTTIRYKNDIPMTLAKDIDDYI